MYVHKIINIIKRCEKASVALYKAFQQAVKDEKQYYDKYCILVGVSVFNFFKIAFDTHVANSTSRKKTTPMKHLPI